MMEKPGTGNRAAQAGSRNGPRSRPGGRVADAAGRSGNAAAVLRRRHPAKIAAVGLLCLGLAGCSILGSGGSERARSTLYAPDPRVLADPSWPAVDWQLSINAPTAARMIDSYRIAVRPVPDQLQVYAGAGWARTPTDMLQDALLRTLEDSGRIAAVSRQGTGIAMDYKLLLDVRRFEADYAGGAMPSATIEVSAKLVHNIDQSIVAARTFLHAEPAGATDTGSVVDAFSRALARAAGEISGWTLSSGQAHENAEHGDSRR